MKKLLILAYYFPPLGMGGTQRAAKFVKYLPYFGWMPIVVTVKDIAYYAKDDSLLEDVKSARIYRTGSLDPQRLISKFKFKKTENELNNKSFTKHKWQKLNKLVSWLLIPDSKLLWLPFAVLKAYRLIRKENIKFVLTTSPPHSIHLTGFILKAMAGVAWIADFRDGWTGGNFQYEPTIFHKCINRQLEKLVLQKADKVIAVSQKLIEYFKNKVPTQESNISVITNGFDSEDISPIEKVYTNDRFTMTFCGSMTTIAPVNSILKGLNYFFKKYADLKDKMLVKLIGMDWNDKVKKTTYEFGLEEVVRLKGYLSHSGALEEILSADLLLYPIADWASLDFIPGKTFEYLASGKPVLIVGPEVEGVTILKNASDVVITNHQDYEAMERAVLKYFTMFKQKSIKKLQKTDIAIYDRKFLSQRLARILIEME